MLMREKIRELLVTAAAKSGLSSDLVFDVGFTTDPKFGDYATNLALVGSKALKMKPIDLAKKLIENLDSTIFEKVEVAGPGFINFTLKSQELLQPTTYSLQPKQGKILLEYFQPNIAKPMHMGLIRTAVIGDALRRMLEYAGQKVESETHMGDWGTQFGFLLLAYKKYADEKIIEKDPVNELNKLYVKINAEAETDESVRIAAKEEFVKLEKGDEENRKIWQKFVDWSMEKFLTINDLMDILPFDHHWPESFYEDKMPAVLEKLKAKSLLKLSQGAQIVDLTDQGLGVAIMIKSDDTTTYILRDLATFIWRKAQGFTKQLYVVDSRQSHTLAQTFAILKLMGEMGETGNEGEHIDYGFISFKGEALSTRKGNMVLAEDVVRQAQEKVAKIIEDKNPELKNKELVIRVVAKAALKYFDLSHNRHSDYEFDWDKVLDFEGDSGPYLQYAYARLASILRKDMSKNHELQTTSSITPTERELLFKVSILPEIVEDALKDYMPNVLANYLYNLAGLINKFYHESPVTQEKDQSTKDFRLALVAASKKTLAQGLNLLGIEALEEM